MIHTKVIAAILAVGAIVILVAIVWVGSRVPSILNTTSGGPPPYQTEPPHRCGMVIEPYGRIECPSP